MIHDDEIVKGCLANKRQAQEALYKKYSRKLFGICLRYTKDYSAAEDVLHESFLKIFRNIASYKGNGSLGAWIRTIVINTALEKFRKHFQMYSISDIDEQSNGILANDIISELNAQYLLKLIADLPPAYKIVFNMYAIDGYSHKEIAEKLSITIGTSKSNLSRARNILQKKIENQYIVTQKEKRC